MVRPNLPLTDIFLLEVLLLPRSGIFEFVNKVLRPGELNGAAIGREQVLVTVRESS